MDANSFRFVLIALAGLVVVSLNVPWRHLARSLSRCVAIVATPQLAAQPLVAAPAVDTRRYRPSRPAHPR